MPQNYPKPAPTPSPQPTPAPKQGFDPDKYLAEKTGGGFDPDRYLAEKTSPPPAVGESALWGLQQGLTYDHMDEAIGALRATVSKIKGDKRTFKDIYETERDALRGFDKRSRAENKWTDIAARGVGGAASLAIPGVNALAPVKGASILANVGKAATLGGVVGLGGSEADTVSGMAKDALTGAVVGGVTQGALQGAGSGLSKLAPSNLKKVAAERAVKAGTGQQVRAIRELAKTKRLDIAGEDLLSADEAGDAVVSLARATPEEIAPVAKMKAQFFGDKISEVAESIDELIPKAVSGKSIANRIRGWAGQNLPPTPNNLALRKQLAKQVEFFEKKGDMGFSQAQKLKNSYRWKMTNPQSQSLGQDATNAIKKAIGGEMDDAVAQSSDMIGNSLSGARDLISRYQVFKRKYGSFKSAADAAQNRVEQNLSNRFISPSDYGIGGVGALSSMLVTGEPITGAALGAIGAFANKIARERGSATFAVTANNLAKILEKNPQALGDFMRPISDALVKGPAALLAAHMALMDDPEYRRIVQPQDGGGLRLPQQGLRLPQ